MKKISAILLALVMLLSMVAMAETVTTGSITIENATVGESYEGYKVFDVGLTTDNTPSYTIESTDSWYTAAAAEGSPFTLTTTDNNLYYVTIKDGKDAEDVVAWFNANKDGKTADLENKTATGNTVEWKDIELGYYFVTSTLNDGAAVTVTTTNPDVTIQDKNQGATPEDGNYKVIVGGDGEGEDAELNSTVAIGDVVNFKLQLNAVNWEGDQKVTSYTATDTMGAGFTFNNDIKVYVTGINNVKTKLETTAYTATVNGNAFTVTIPWVDTTDAQAHLYDANTLIEIEYTATVNASATSNPTSNLTNEGSWGEDMTTKTTSYTYEFDLVKTDADKKLLDGAEFQLYVKGENNPINLVKVDDSTYRYAASTDTNIVTTIVVKDGQIKVTGLDKGEYELLETKAPAGYNLLTDRINVTVNANNTATVTDNVWQSGGIQVTNNTGSTLPSTGGIGTTIFYVVGGLMMAAAVVLLVAKKKVSA